MQCPKCGGEVANINDHYAGCPEPGAAIKADNPRAVAGHNSLVAQIASIENFGAEVAEYLASEFAELDRSIADVLNEARDLPKVIEDDDTLGTVSTVAKRIKDVATRAEGIRAKEKEPFLRAVNAVDQFFFARIDKLAKRAKGNANGGYDILLARIGDYQNRKLAEAQAERDRIAREELRKAQELQRIADEEARKAEELRLAAERARKPEIKEQKTAVADQAIEQAAIAAAQADTAVDAAQSARIDTLAKPADMIRHRAGSGALSTTAREPYAIVVDAAKLDMALLWPFITLDAKEKALRAWAKTHGHTTQMAGAEIGHRNKPTVR